MSRSRLSASGALIRDLDLGYRVEPLVGGNLVLHVLREESSVHRTINAKVSEFRAAFPSMLEELGLSARQASDVGEHWIFHDDDAIVGMCLAARGLHSDQDGLILPFVERSESR